MAIFNSYVFYQRVFHDNPGDPQKFCSDSDLLAGTWIMSIRLAVRYAIFMPFLWLFLAVFWISWLRQEKLAVAKMEEEERMRRGC